MSEVLDIESQLHGAAAMSTAAGADDCYYCTYVSENTTTVPSYQILPAPPPPPQLPLSPPPFPPLQFWLQTSFPPLPSPTQPAFVSPTQQPETHRLRTLVLRYERLLWQAEREAVRYRRTIAGIRNDLRDKVKTIEFLAIQQKKQQQQQQQQRPQRTAAATATAAPVALSELSCSGGGGGCCCCHR